MRPFAYVRPAGIADAIAAGQGDGVRYLGGGTNLLDLMKMGVEQPVKLVDVSRLPLAAITEQAGGVRIGAEDVAAGHGAGSRQLAACSLQLAACSKFG